MAEMQSKRTHQSLLTILLLAVSIIAITPLIHAAQPATNLITINATGNATPIGNGPSGPTTLNLKAMSYRDQNNWLIIQNATGTLTIGSSTFAIFNGQGSVNSFGDVAIFADTNASSSQSELVLHGSMTESNVSFDSPSQLVSSANLALSGTLDQDNAQAASPVTGSISVSATNASRSVTSSTNATATNSTRLTSTAPVSQDSTQTTTTGNATNISANSTVASAVLAQNSTQTGNSTVTTLATNSTLVSEPATQNSTQPRLANVTTTSNNSTVPSMPNTNNAASTTALIANGNALNNASTTGTVTVTVTQYANQTISTTQTVASVTISYTATVTMANANVTQGNETTTVTTTMET